MLLISQNPARLVRVLFSFNLVLSFQLLAMEEQKEEIIIKEQTDKVFYQEINLEKTKNDNDIDLSKILNLITNKKKTVKELQENGAIVFFLFIRSLGCPFCFQEIHDLYKNIGIFKRFNINFVIVAPESEDFQNEWCCVDEYQKYAKEFHILNDAKRTIRKTFNIVDYDVNKFFPLMPKLLYRWYNLEVNSTKKFQQFILNDKEAQAYLREMILIKDGKILGRSRESTPIDRSDYLSLVLSNDGVEINTGVKRQEKKLSTIYVETKKNKFSCMSAPIDYLAFSEVLENYSYSNQFLAYLLSEYAEENLLFLKDVSIFNKIPNSELKWKKLKEIFDIYLAKDADMPVNTNEEHKKAVFDEYQTYLNCKDIIIEYNENYDNIINNAIEVPSDVFDEIVKEVKESLSDNYDRFKKTTLYKQMIQKKPTHDFYKICQ